MIPLPRKLRGGFRARVINGLIDYCESITPLPSRTIKYERYPRGYTAEVARVMAATVTRHAFDVYQSGALKVRVHPGTVYLAGIKKTVSLLSFSTDITVVPNASHEWFCWIAVNRATASATFGSGDDPGNGTDTTEYYVLTKATTNSTDTTITALAPQWHNDIHESTFS